MYIPFFACRLSVHMADQQMQAAHDINIRHQAYLLTDACALLRSNWYIAPFLAQIGWLRGEELRKVQERQHKGGLGISGTAS